MNIFQIENIEGICIIKFSGSLNFVNQRYFKQQIHKIVKKNPTEVCDKTHFLTATSKTTRNSGFEEVSTYI